jgi:hypothetical protein
MTQVRLETTDGTFVTYGYILPFQKEYPKVLSWGTRVFHQYPATDTPSLSTVYREAFYAAVTLSDVDLEAESHAQEAT